MIKTDRCHYSKRFENEKSLEERLNEISDAGNKILFVTSEYYGGGEVGYTIIYKEEPHGRID